LLLESLQVFTPDRHADLDAAVISAGGAMAAIVPADFLIRAPRRLTGRAFLTLARAGLLTPADSDQAKLPALAGPVRRQLQSS
jgi:hypothetical protein